MKKYITILLLILFFGCTTDNKDFIYTGTAEKINESFQIELEKLGALSDFLFLEKRNFENDLFAALGRTNCPDITMNSFGVDSIQITESYGVGCQTDSMFVSGDCIMTMYGALGSAMSKVSVTTENDFSVDGIFISNVVLELENNNTATLNGDTYYEYDLTELQLEIEEPTSSNQVGFNGGTITYVDGASDGTIPVDKDPLDYSLINIDLLPYSIDGTDFLLNLMDLKISLGKCETYEPFSGTIEVLDPSNGNSLVNTLTFGGMNESCGVMEIN